MFTPIHIRLAEAYDAALVASLSRQTFIETFAVHNTQEDMDSFMNVQFTTEILMKEVDAPGYIFLLAYMNDEPVGYVGMRESKNPPALGNANAIEIARIYTLQKTLGKGVGKALIQKCLEIAAEKNKEVIWLGVWEHNGRAIEFYTRWGFEKFSDHEFVLGSEVQKDWLMKKSI